MMIDKPSLDWLAVMPEVVLAVGAIVVLLVGLMPGRMARVLLPVLSLTALGAAMYFAVTGFDTPRLGAWSGQIDADQIANAVRALAAGAGIITVLFAAFGRTPDGREGEYHALLLAAVCGMGLFGAAGSLVSLFVGLELFSIALYVLCALEAERVSSLEAGLKYLIIGGMGSAVLLYGSALVYGATGSFDLSTIGASSHRGALLWAGEALLLSALAFKASVAPLHWWTPDVYDGAPTTITAFMATATKAAAFLALARVLIVGFHLEANTWEPLVAALAVASIVVGNVGALAQQRIKRMLAYSSIAHAGYLLIGIVAWQTIGVTALVYALVVYIVMTLGAFALVLLRERQVEHAVTYDDLSGIGWGSMSDVGWLSALPGISMVIFMLSLAGIPPTAGFFAKFGLFDAAVNAGYGWLAVVGVLGSAVSLGYYLRVIVTMYMHPASAAESAATGPDSIEDLQPSRHPVLASLGVALAVLSLALAFPPGGAFDSACDAGHALTGEGTAHAGCAERVVASVHG